MEALMGWSPGRSRFSVGCQIGSPAFLSRRSINAPAEGAEGLPA